MTTTKHAPPAGPAQVERAILYHFTDTARLPWIIDSGELRAGSNRVGGYPVDFLWATTSPTGDRTASSVGGHNLKAFRAGYTRQARFTLAAEDFEPWPQILNRFPQWTPDHVRRLEGVAKARGQVVSCWFCRAEPLLLERVIAIETRSWTKPNWALLETVQALPIPDEPDGRYVLINDHVYGSVRGTGPQGQQAYSVFAGYTRARTDVERVLGTDILYP